MKRATFLWACFLPLFSFAQSTFAPTDTNNTSYDWSTGTWTNGDAGTNASGNGQSYNLGIWITNDVAYDVAPMSLEVGVARGVAGGLLSPASELGNTETLSNEWQEIVVNGIRDVTSSGSEENPLLFDTSSNFWSPTDLKSVNPTLEAMGQAIGVAPSNVTRLVTGAMPINQYKGWSYYSGSLAINTNRPITGLETDAESPTLAISGLGEGIARNAFTWDVFSPDVLSRFSPFMNAFRMVSTTLANVVLAISLAMGTLSLVSQDVAPTKMFTVFLRALPGGGDSGEEEDA